jgi:hypothetical protein
LRCRRAQGVCTEKRLYPPAIPPLTFNPAAEIRRRLHDDGYVLETGRVVLEGQHRALMADDRVRQAFLGM